MDVGYYTANITHLGKERVGTGKLDLNFVNEGQLYQTAQWSDLKSKEPFFAQINLPEAEYDIYDRKSSERSGCLGWGKSGILRLPLSKM